VNPAVEVINLVKVIYVILIQIRRSAVLMVFYVRQMVVARDKIFSASFRTKTMIITKKPVFFFL
jgi:hypothetical protein